MKIGRGASEHSQNLVGGLQAVLEARPVEDRLLAATTRLHVDDASSQRIERLLTEGPDWERFVPKAEAHAVAPLVYRTLSRTEFARLVPQTALARLQSRYLANGVSNLLWLRELKNLLLGLNGSGISPVLLKGAALLHTVYPDPALRQLRDLDLLVHPDQLPAAEQCLLALGYTPAEKEWPAGTWPPDWYEKKYWRPDRTSWGALVEIHWGVARQAAPINLAAEDLLQGSEDIVVDGVPARVLCPTHQVLHIATHLACNDGFGVGLARPSDLHETVEMFGHRLDWEHLADEARQFRASLCLRYSLAVAGALFGTSFPPGLLGRPSDPPLRPSLATAAFERVLDNDRDPAPLPSTLAKLVTTDRTDFRALRQLLLPRQRDPTAGHRVFHPLRFLRALHYARSAW